MPITNRVRPRPIVAAHAVVLSLLFAAFAPASTQAANAPAARVLIGRGEAVQTVGLARPEGLAGIGGPASRARIDRPMTLVADRFGGYYFTDIAANRVFHVLPSGRLMVAVGSGAPNNLAGEWCSHDRPALETCLLAPHGVDVDRDGSLIVTDTFHDQVLRVGGDGIARRIVGTGGDCNPRVSGCGEGGPPLRATLHLPIVAHPTSRGLVIADTASRVLLAHDGRLDRIAGTGVDGLSGDGGPATRARIYAPADAVPWRGGWLIADGSNCLVRWVDPQGVMRPFAGYGGDLGACRATYALRTWGDPPDWDRAYGPPWKGSVGDGGPALRARFGVTGFLAVDGATVYLDDFTDNRIRAIRDGRITTVAGTGERRGTNGDSAARATSFRLAWPTGVAVMGRDLLIADWGAHRIVAVDLSAANAFATRKTRAKRNLRPPRRHRGRRR